MHGTFTLLTQLIRDMYIIDMSDITFSPDIVVVLFFVTLI
jgi:hypothetical protein